MKYKFFKSIFFVFFSLNIFSQDMSVQDIQSFIDLPDSIKNQISNSQSEETTNMSSLEQQKAAQEDQEMLENAELTSNDPFFGYNFFEPNVQTYEIESTILDVPLQGDYLISLDDSLELLLSGNTNKNLKLRVDLSGNIFIPEIGNVSLLNLSLEEARKKIQEIINEAYLGTDSFLSVEKPSLRKISIIGAVKKPGIYVVNPFSSVIDAIKYAGGLINNSSLRNIIVRSFDGNEKTIDMYDFLIFGNRDSKLSIKNGDTVIIGYTDRFLVVRGEVNNPARYEYISGDSIKRLLSFSGGINSYGDASGVYLSFFEEGKRRIIKPDYNDFLPNGVIDSILVSNQILDTSNEMIEVLGSAVRQGFYKKEENLKDIIGSLKFSSEVYPFFALLEGVDKNGLSKISTPFSLIDSATQDINLDIDEVKLLFFSREEINEVDNLLNGNYSGSLSQESLDQLERISRSYLVNFIAGERNLRIPIRGEYSPKQLFNYFDVQGILNFSDTTLLTKGNVYLDSFEKVVSSSSDQVINIPSENFLILTTEIRGEVKYPGSYKVNRNTTLNELYEIAGGFTSKANLDGIVFSREKLRVMEKESYDSAKEVIYDGLVQMLSNPRGSEFSIDPTVFAILEKEIQQFPGRLSGNLRPNSNLAIESLLEGADSIFVPSKSNLISILGQVMVPGTIPHKDNANLNYYVDKSGGLTDFADESSIYVIKPNGEIEKASRKFFSGELTLQPGDILIVPRNLDKIAALPLIQSSIEVLSNLALTAASLNAIK